MRETTDRRYEFKFNGKLESIMEFIRESLGSITRNHRTSQNEPDTRESQTLRHVILSGYTIGSATQKPEDARYLKKIQMECVLLFR